MSTSRDEANRLTKYRLVYAGALAELGQGRPLGLLPRDYPGLPLVRGLIEKVLLTRAELNGVTRVLIEKGVASREELDRVFGEEYAWLADAHEKLTGFKATLEGLTITAESARRAIQHQAERANQDGGSA